MNWNRIRANFLSAAATCLLAVPAGAITPRERAEQLIPELMGRIVEAQEEIREREGEYSPVIRQYDDQLGSLRDGIHQAESERDQLERLADYVETYATRLEVQEEGLRAIEKPLLRMRADAREYERAASQARRARTAPDEQREFFEHQFQGVAGALSRLGERLGRQDEIANTGALLQASWAAQGALQLPVSQLDATGAKTFARRIETRFAQLQARSNQLHSERRAVRQLLDLLIERQLGQRIDALFADSGSASLSSLLAPVGKSADWQDLSSVTARVLGMQSLAANGSDRRGRDFDQLDFFANGQHRNPGGE